MSTEPTAVPAAIVPAAIVPAAIQAVDALDTPSYLQAAAHLHFILGEGMDLAARTVAVASLMQSAYAVYAAVRRTAQETGAWEATATDRLFADLVRTTLPEEAPRFMRPDQRIWLIRERLTRAIQAFGRCFTAAAESMTHARGRVIEHETERDGRPGGARSVEWELASRRLRP